MTRRYIELDDATLGERRVRTGFSPSDVVTRIKRDSAALIDLIDALPAGGRGEASRCKSIAMTEIESACHWAVKAATAIEGD